MKILKKGRTKMFRKHKPVKVMHYEGIKDFPTDCPCTLEIVNENLIITRRKSETTVTLPLNRINSFNIMGENAFLQQYKGTGLSKSGNNITKSFLIVQYDKGILVLWRTSLKTHRYFMNLQYNVVTQTKNIEL